MRRIFIEDGLSVRFPGRDEEFDQGFEMGILATLMSAGPSQGAVCISSETLAQAHALAERMGFRLVCEPAGDGFATVTLASRQARPRLRVVHSCAEPHGAEAVHERAGAASPRPVLVSA